MVLQNDFIFENRFVSLLEVPGVFKSKRLFWLIRPDTSVCGIKLN